MEDLVKFCQTQNFMQFNSKDSGYSLHVQVPCESFSIEDSSDELTFYGNVKLMHTGRNRNGSSLTEKGAKSCLSSIAYKPILADFTDVNGERDFTYHAMEFNDDGSRTYIERQVGCFTADKPYMKQDPDNVDRKYIYAKVAIPREYTDAAEIIERKGGTKLSAELSINEMSYSAEESLLYLDDVEVMGCTLLGTDPDTGKPVLEGMEGACLQIEDFSANNNSIVNKAELINEITNAVIQQLNDRQTEFSVEEETKKGGNDVAKDNLEFEETEVKATEEEATTETPEVVEEESAEVETMAEENEETEEEDVKNEVEQDEDVEDEDGEDEESDDTEEFEETTADDTAETSEEDHQSVSAIEDEDSTGTRVENSLNYSVTVDGVTKEFAVSLRDKINAVAILVNDTYAESDNAWYDVDVYEDDGKYCVMHDWWNDRHFKQEYSVKKDVYSLKGDRVVVRMQFLTDDEIAKLEKMKADFAAIETELNSYKEAEVHSQREAVLSSEDYSVMAEFAEFKELKDHMDDYSVEDLTKEADLLYAKFMKSNYSNFSATNKPEKKRSMVFMTTGEKSQEEKLPYGGLFKNFNKKK